MDPGQAAAAPVLRLEQRSTAQGGALAGLRYFLIYTMAAALVAGAGWGGAWTFLAVIVGFVVIPIIDALAGREEQHDADASARPLLPRLALGLVTPVHAAVLAWTISIVATRSLTTVEWIGLVLSTGVWSGGGAITVAHELMHRRSRWARAAGEALMTSVCYPHFCVEHVAGHHRNVATPKDPASARFGESFYRFLPRCVLGGMKSAWRLEGERVAKKGRGFLGLGDARLRQPLLLFAGLAALAAWGGPAVLAFFLLQSAVAILLLEAVNYVEHYGLERRRLADGRYESVQPIHSWDSHHRVTNWFLFHLPRHSDHHAVASRPFHALRTHAEGPQLPAGYSTMTLAALVPPLWRRIMDPRVRAWRARVAG